MTNLASAVEFQFRQEVPVEHITRPSIPQSDEFVLRLDISPGLRDLIIAYLRDDKLHDNKAKALKSQHATTRYVNLGDLLYKKSYSKSHSNPYLRCLGLEEAKKVMQEIHDGECGNYTEERSLTHKAITQEYYWPKMFTDAKGYVKRCPQCYRFAPFSH